jgi:DNA-binding NarL/FixJ family response regulator/type II secretory pathway predicted ATPase ExeA
MKVQNDPVAAASELIGRERELERLAELAGAAGSGRGALVLLAGEAGAGKTVLARAAAAATGFLTLEAAALETPGPPYRQIAAVLRAYRRDRGSLLEGQPGLRDYLACVLPELAPGQRPFERDAVGEAVAAAFQEMAAEGPLAVLLDDLQWSDEATLELLRLLAEVADRSRILLLGAYRSDAMTRTHPMRRLRTELRRSGLLNEMVVEALGLSDTGLLLNRVLARPASPEVVAAVHSRTEGLPFFVEELAAALRDGGSDPLAPLPESVRDAILARVNALPEDVRLALGVAAVIGQEFDLGLVAELQGAMDGLDRLADSGLTVEDGEGSWAFRHALVREAIYADLSWSRRRATHRALAERLQDLGAPAGTIASHWLAAGERERGRKALLAAADAARAACAPRDAAASLSRALDLWPSGTDPHARLDALEGLGDAAELFGDPVVAARAWSEAAEGLGASGQTRRLAEAQRRLAVALGLQGAWERALAAHQDAARAFAASGQPGEAAAERLSAAARFRSAGSFVAALRLLEAAGPEAEMAGRTDLGARIAALEGNVLCRMGDAQHGLARVRGALDLALSKGHVGAATEAYQRLADSLEQAGDYKAARAAYVEATQFCRASGALATADLCLGCLTWVLRQLGEWDRAVDVCRDVLSSTTSTLHAQAAAHGVLGSIELLRGRASHARPHLHSSHALAQRIDLAAMELDSGAALARLDVMSGRPEAALERCQAILQCWERTDCEGHYSVPIFRWMATLGAEQGSAQLVHSCTSALARIVARSSAEAMAALAHALGEAAMLEGDAASAAAQFEQALAVGAELDLPLERAEIERRAAAALAAAGRRAEAVELLVSAHRTARRLGARPLAARIAEQVTELGEQVERRLGRMAAARAEHAGLSRRELEIARLVASGQTSREIAGRLSLSPRTVEMHVHNVLMKLDCRSRVDIARRAGELGLLV